MAGGYGRRGQVPNEEVPYHVCNVQDMMMGDLQRQVAINPASSGAKLGDVLRC